MALANPGVYALAINPSDTAVIYAGLWGDGVLRSMNGGASWETVNTGLTNTNVLALAGNPASPGSFYAGTAGNGLFVITFGMSWLNLLVSGSGTISSDYLGIYCNADYSRRLYNGTIVNLHGEPEEYFVFTGWSGACSGASDCEFSMAADTSVTATFTMDSAHKTRIGETENYFSTLQEAYDHAPADSTIKVWGVDFREDLTAGLSKSVILIGGHSADYLENNGYTLLHGVLTITSGSLTVEKLAIL
jgi:hypothetical protein